MAASVQFRPQSRDLGVMMRDVDENLAIYLGIRHGCGNKIDDEHLLLNEEEDHSDEFDYSKETKPDNFLSSEPPGFEIVEMAADGKLLNLETDKDDNNWLSAEPDLSVLPSIEAKEQDPVITQTSSCEGIISPTSEANASEESASPGKPKCSSSAAASNKRPSSSSRSQKPNSRPSTPSVKPTLPSKSKSSRPSTPTSRTTLPSSKPKPEQTTVSRPSVSKSSSRSSTPTRKIATPSSSDRSSLAQKAVSTVSKNPTSSRVGSSSHMVKPRPLKSPDILSMSHDALQNPKMTVTKRPVSASRGRPNSTNSSSSSSNGKLRQQSCSPAKTRVPVVPNCSNKTGSIMLSRSRGYGINVGDDVNPVVIGTKMVERVVNMRKLAPPKQDEYTSQDNKPKKSSKDNSGFGRSLSNKSLDMAIRHMDIRRSIPELRPVVTSGIKPRAIKRDMTPDVTESPLTSSSGSESSKYSVESCKSCIISHFSNGTEVDD